MNSHANTQNKHADINEYQTSFNRQKQQKQQAEIERLNTQKKSAKIKELDDR